MTRARRKLHLACLFLLSIPLAAQPAGSGKSFLVEEVFPHIAVGGVWSTELTFVNLGSEPAAFPLRFFKPDGSPWPVQVGTGSPGSVFVITTQPGVASMISLQPKGPEIETGWAEIEQPTSTSIGGHAVFSDQTPGRPVFEAIVPLARWNDTDFLMPFDNTAGNVTCMALANPSGSTGTSLSLEFTSVQGTVLAATTRDLEKKHQQSFCLPQEFPSTAGQSGSLRVAGSASRLSALGFRFRPGGAFTTFFTMSGL